MCHPPGSDVKIKPGNYVFKYHAAGKRLPIGAKNTVLTFSTPPKQEPDHVTGYKKQEFLPVLQGKKGK